MGAGDGIRCRASVSGVTLASVWLLYPSSWACGPAGPDGGVDRRFASRTGGGCCLRSGCDTRRPCRRAGSRGGLPWATNAPEQLEVVVAFDAKGGEKLWKASSRTGDVRYVRGDEPGGKARR